MAYFSVVGTPTDVDATYTNPYTDETLTVKGVYYLDDTVTYGTDGDDRVSGNSDNQLWLLEDEDGVQMFSSIETYSPSSGDDIILLASDTIVLGDITLYASSGDDIVWSNAGNDRLYGNEGNDTIYGGPGNDIICGGEDDDTLAGNSGRDILQGDAGNDLLIGGDGNDRYYYSVNDGDDIIIEASGYDTIHLNEGISFADITFSQVDSHLVITVNTEVTGSIKVSYFYLHDNFLVEEIAFSDGSTFDLTSLITSNQAPIANNDSFDGTEDTVISGNVLDNNGNGADSDPDGDAISIVMPGTFDTYGGGTVVLNEDGTFIYTPAANFYGTDSFIYAITDGTDTDNALVFLNVMPVNDAPIAVDDSFDGTEDTVITGNVLTDSG
ncbi:MAG: cadherin-like domain-containing protein, partial [Alphaproteobacteria bacterium]|nr:cadherin-like domain-containing protein [Alphaproteobacteria bacterium]